MDLADRRDLERDVYQPAEDSALLAEVATTVVGADDLVLDVGTGSGFVAERIADVTGAAVVGSDLNPHACRRASERGVPVVRGDLTEPFAAEAFDVVTFNPPYIPTDAETEWDDWMEVALSGGETGRAVVDPFLASVRRVLAPGGVVLLLVSSLSGVDEVVELAGEEGFGAVALRDESYPFETLTVLKLIPPRESP
ncbi:MAG: release factor glutamine methyltransferase [Halobacteriales archaeon]